MEQNNSNSKKGFKPDTPATQEPPRLKWFTVLATLVVIALIAVSILAAIYLPAIAIFVPILAIGLALALQKYTASFVAYFVICFSKIYSHGDRIRIGNIKGDVRRVGILHTTLDEVGEDEKLGGELTGRLLHFPNLLILDQPVLNYSKGCSIDYKTISSSYMFDEVRVPITTESNVEKACVLLEAILKDCDQVHIKRAEQAFQNGYPRFLNEALKSPRVLVHIEPQHIWIKGKFVTPVHGRNELKSEIVLQFIKKLNDMEDVKLA